MICYVMLRHNIPYYIIVYYIILDNITQSYITLYIEIYYIILRFFMLCHVATFQVLKYTFKETYSAA